MSVFEITGDPSEKWGSSIIILKKVRNDINNDINNDKGHMKDSKKVTTFKKVAYVNLLGHGCGTFFCCR